METRHDFQGKRVLITGAGRGIGRHLAKVLSATGATVVALSRTEEHLQSLKQEDESIEIAACDVTDWQKTRELVNSLGDIDMLVNNAGIMQYSPLLHVSEEYYDSHFDLNVKAAWNVSQVVAGNLVKRECPGSIVNISSIASHLVLPGHEVYSMTKCAMDKMTELMAKSLGPNKIRVNAVNPGLVDETGIADQAVALSPNAKDSVKMATPLKDVVNKDDVTSAVLFLLDDQTARMVTGVCMDVSGGM